MQGTDWREVLRESTWLTIAWEWLQTLLARAVDLVLWVTMVFSCYQLIPSAPQPAAGVSTFMFIMQFIALDIGGLSMNQLARRQGLEKWAYARIVAYILIAITLITISFAGVERAVKMPADVVGWVEVVLVVARSVMTVLYGMAMHSLKEEETTTRDRLAELESEVPGLREQASTVQQQLFTVQSQMSSLQKELDGSRGEVSSLRQQLDKAKQEVSTLQGELETGHGDTAGLRRELNSALVQVETLQAQLDGKKQELAGLREMLESGQEWQESRVRGVLQTEQQRVSNLQEQLAGEQAAGAALRKQLNTAAIEADGLRQQVEAKQREVQQAQAILQQRLDAKQREVERVQQALNDEQQTVSSLKQALEMEQQRVSTLHEKLSTVQSSQVSSGQSNGQGKVDGGQGKVLKLDTSRPRRNGQGDAAENAIAEQIRLLMLAEPGISGRGIASRLGCSPTTAAKWKGIIEAESMDCVNE